MDCQDCLQIVDILNINSSNAKTLDCQVHRRQCSSSWPWLLWHKVHFHLQFSSCHQFLLRKGHPVSDSRMLLLLSFPQWSLLACVAEAKFQFIFRKLLLCLFSLRDSSLGLSLASGFCTYSILPNSFSLNVASVFLQWPYFMFACSFRSLTYIDLHW